MCGPTPAHITRGSLDESASLATRGSCLSSVPTEVSDLPRDLQKKTSNFAAAIACLCLSLPRSRGEAKTLGHKLLKSSTSIAARARAASHSESDADFCSKLEGAIQEADESMLCLEMLRDDCAINEHSLTYLHQEAKEIGTILVSVIGRIRGRSF